jgi:peroxiredoxin
MKKYLYFAFTLFAAAACGNNQAGYQIKGSFTGDPTSYEGKKVFLLQQKDGATVTDTAVIAKKTFKFKGETNDPQQASLKIEGVQGTIPIFLENFKYTVVIPVDSLRGAVVDGGETQHIITTLAKDKQEIGAKYNMQALLDEYTKGNPTEDRKKQILDTYNQYKDELTKADNAVIKAVPYTFYSLQQIDEKIDVTPIDTVDAWLGPYRKETKFQNTTALKNIEDKVAAIKRLMPGNVAPDFTLPTPDGKTVTFSEVYKKNKITMLYIWAGWCTPCRNENPQYVSLYNEYHKKGFEILGVSFDNSRDTWLQVIKEDKLTWPQGSEVKFWNTFIRDLYKVSFIPQNVIVDQNGTILASKIEVDSLKNILVTKLPQ